MKFLSLALLASVALLLPTAVEAHGYRHGRHHHGHGKKHFHSHWHPGRNIFHSHRHKKWGHHRRNHHYHDGVDIFFNIR